MGSRATNRNLLLFFENDRECPRALVPALCVEKKRPAFRGPLLFVDAKDAIPIFNRRGRIIDPLSERRSTVDDIDGSSTARFVFVMEVIPDLEVRLHGTQRFEQGADQPVGPEALGSVAGKI